ncbi:MAG: hypothetical protein KY439_08650 [Actinobacteria bacterium]|nr:hypothetical protein [Actinomycetota bacterium]
MGCSASLNPSNLAVIPGSQAEAELRVRNTGTVVDQLRVEILGDAAPWVTAVPPSVSLFPGAEATVRLFFRPEAVPGGPAGAVPFGVRVRSQEDPEGSVVEEGVLDVAAVLGVTAELIPRTSRGRRKAEHSLAISNTGTRPFRAKVAASDPDRHLAFAVEPTEVTAEPDTASFVKIKVRPTKPFRRGVPQTRMFNVTVEEAGQQVAAVQGMMMQEAIEPPWLRRAVLASLLALLALVGLWFGLLRPTVRSAAKEAAQEAVAPPTIGPGGGDDAGGGGGGGPGSGSGGGGGDVSVAGAGPGTAIGGRLFLTDKGTTSFAVPSGSTLQLTDVVLQNPAGDTGPLHIRRDGTPLLVVELANFRDLDYHFVAPILFTAGQKLELFADCTSPGCTPGAYFAGFVVRG